MIKAKNIKNQTDKAVVCRTCIPESISIAIYAFIFISLLLALAYQFIYPPVKYIIPILILGLFAYLFKKPFWGLVTLVIALPFHAFLTMLARYYFLLNGQQVFFVAFWKELLIILLVTVVLIKSLWRNKLPFKILTIDWLIFALFGLGILSIIYGTKNLNQAIWGLRTDFEFFITYFLARSIINNKNQLKILLASILGSGVLVVLFGFIQVYFLPVDYLMRFGYTLLPWVPDGPLQAYQTVGNLVRIISTFSGAIQLGPYLAILILLSISLLVFIRSKIIKIFLAFISILCLFSLYYTFTRSAWLGLAVSLFVLILILLQKSFKKISTSNKRIISVVLIVVFSAGLILGVSFLLKSAVLGGATYFDELVLHRTSTSEHLASITESLKTIKNNPFGSGLGTSGLVTLRFGHRSLSENWYLQIALEMGVLGLGIFIAIMVFFIRSMYRLYRDNKDNFIKGASLGVMLSFVCFSVVGLFLHAWGDNTVVALTFWILTGGLIEYQVLQKSN